MLWCPECDTEYDEGVANCGDCGAALVDKPPTGAKDGADDMVVILEARSITEAQVAEATLEAEGIDALVQNIASASPNIGVMGGDVPELDVMVASEDAARAEEILNEPPISDEELAEAAESDSGPGNREGVV